MGYSIKGEFPSRFLSGDEIAGHEIPVIIKEVRKENAFSPKTQKNESVLVAYFDGKDRGVRLGKERAKELVSITGSDDTDAWKGQQVYLTTEKKFAFGRQNNVIHFKVAPSSKGATKDAVDDAKKVFDVL